MNLSAAVIFFFFHLLLKISKRKFFFFKPKKKKITAALRFIRSHQIVKVDVGRFLEAAFEEKDRVLFYNVWTFFDHRSQISENLRVQYAPIWKSYFNPSPNEK